MSSLIGQFLGRYHILEQLGEGGMATVYKAHDTRLERDVAVKVIRTDQFGSAMLERILKRFEREAKALARLTHPNIVNINDYGEQDGIPYLVMEYLPGGTLKARLGKPMPWSEACKLLLPIAQALDYAHEQGLIHRDVKPSNILLTHKGQPMLSDFGIVKILDVDETTALTGTGMGLGTPEYMAPEQWMGKTSPQTDIYALGVIFYEMVTGKKLYTADTPAAILLKQATESLPRPSEVVPGLPKVVESVLLKALAKKPEDRYPDMQSFAEALENLGSGQVGAQARLMPPAKTRPEKSIVGAPLVQKPIVEKKVEPKQSSSQPLTLTRKPFDRRWILALGGIIVLFIIVLGLVFLGQPDNGFFKKTATSTLTKLPSATLSSTPVPSSTFTPRPSLTNTATNTLLPEFTATLTPTPTEQVFYCDYSLGIASGALLVNCKCIEQSCSCTDRYYYKNGKFSQPNYWNASLESVRKNFELHHYTCP